MDTRDYLRDIVEKIHTTIIATTDENGYPYTCAIDMMDYDDHHLYFLTAKGKDFYKRLINQKYLAFTGLKGEDTMTSIAISFRGKVKCLGKERLTQLFEKNPYMYDIYPTDASREALEVFCIYEGEGEYFDLSQKPIVRAQFQLGTYQSDIKTYHITNRCIGCNKCLNVCPQSCITHTSIPYTIETTHCLHCGNCLEVCPQGAVVYE